MVSQDGAGSVASILQPNAEKARGRGRSRRDGAQARSHDLARPDDREGLRLRAASVHGDETPEGGSEGWGSPCLRQGWPGPGYWIKEIREREAGYVARVEQAYERMVAAW